MAQAVSEILEVRTRALRRGRLPGYLASLGLHLAVVLTVTVLPMLAATERVPPEYVQVQIVPVQALGVPEPQPARSEPRRDESARREPEPEQTKTAAPAPEPRAASPKPVPETTRPANRQPATETSTTTPAGDLPRREGSPTGSTLGSSAFGAAVAGFDNPDFTYDYYVTQMLHMIRAHWLRPPLGGALEAVVHYRIQRDGTVYDTRIVTSSGYSSFDLAALRAVEAASPLPPLPRSFRHDSLGVNLIVR